MDTRNALVNAQVHIRQNADEQSTVLKDLSSWEQEMRLVESNYCSISDLKDKSLLGQTPNLSSEAPIPKIFDSDLPSLSCNSALSEIAVEQERLKGNKHFSSQNYAEAVRSYTKCIQMNPTSPVPYSNRAMAHLKLKQWAKAESDASSALNIDPSHFKSYQRRSMARSSLGKIRASLQDLFKAKALAENSDEGLKILKRIYADIEKVKAMLTEAILKAPKKKVTLRFTSNPTRANRGSDTSTALSPRRTTKEDLQVPEKIFQSTNPDLDSQRICNIRSWLEFEQLWKSLKEDEKRNCLEIMRPQSFATIYRSGMEDSDMLFDLVLTCGKIAQSKGYKILQVLSEMKSIDMVTMMLNSSENEEVIKVIKDLSKTKAAAKSIMRRFGL
eukprot:scaffold12402_cov246-Chaetoceros_neogracile.AAC.1